MQCLLTNAILVDLEGDELDDIDEVPPACLQRQRRARQLFHFQR